MTITIHSPWHCGTRISEDQFVAELHRRGALSADNPLWRNQNGETPEQLAREVYRAIVSYPDESAELWIMVAHKEHQIGVNTESVLGRNDTRSWGNTRSCQSEMLTRVPWKSLADNVNLRSGTHQQTTSPPRTGYYTRYWDVVDSINDCIYRVRKPGFDYQEAGATTISEVVHVWAPGEDDNDPDGYAQTVARGINEIRARYGVAEQEPSMDRPSIALSAGHHNSSGGDPHETVQTGQLTPVIAATLRARGMDVRVITPDDGRGMHGGTLSDVARQVVTWAGEGWTADVFLEVHTEGNGAGDAGRGAFAIYPDWGDDVDRGTRDGLGPEIVRRLLQATGLPPRGNGLMSEKKTGVGAQGHRLGVFGATASLRTETTRLIVEYGSHSSPKDLAIWAQDGFLQRAADATADAIAFYLGWQQAPAQPSAPPKPEDLPVVLDPWREYAGGNPYSREFWIPQPFIDWIKDHGGFWSVGFAYTGAFIPPDTGVLTQFFQGAALEWHPENYGTEYEVLRRHIGVELLTQLYPEHAPKAA